MDALSDDSDAHSLAATDDGSQPSRTLIVPHDRIVAIEHPCIIRDADKGIRALGGEHQIKHVCHTISLC